MEPTRGFSVARFLAMLRKEWIEMRRDRATVGFTVALPLIQLFIFGYALNGNPRHLQTGLLIAGESRYARTIEAALVNTGYFDLRGFATEAEAEEAIRKGTVQFVVNIPPGFDRDVEAVGR